ncbi:conserved protein of unknown function [Tenacibaculum sp. 190524A02b]|uniref:hypothetical protein n=1 Tax=Tenacibaculum vairaonense TaxID=3137860 RepID=UPI0032B27413
MTKIQKIIYYSVLSIFSCYWFTTIFFNTPDNYIKIKLLKEHRAFETFFYQNWGFFAPPPNTNERLYCVIHNKKDSVVSRVFELVSPIIEEKLEKAPFNSKADLMDYVISSSTVGLNNKMVSLNKTIAYMETKGKLTEKERKEILTQGVEETNHFKTLIKYAKEIALKKSVDLDESLISIELTKIRIPKFVDRDKKVSLDEDKEELIFRSKLFDSKSINKIDRYEPKLYGEN